MIRALGTSRVQCTPDPLYGGTDLTCSVGATIDRRQLSDHRSTSIGYSTTPVGRITSRPPAPIRLICGGLSRASVIGATLDSNKIARLEAAPFEAYTIGCPSDRRLHRIPGRKCRALLQGAVVCAQGACRISPRRLYCRMIVHARRPIQ
jgi:hypothetical protein